RAANEKGAPVEAFVTLAELYERGHRAGEAALLIERALALQTEHPMALLAQVRLVRLTGEIEQAEKHARALLQKSECDPQIRIRAWYELGGILDRQKRFDEAMTAFKEAKALQRPAAAPVAAILQSVQA